MARSTDTAWLPAQASALTELPRPVYFRSYGLAKGTHVESHTHHWIHLIYARSGVMQIQAKSSRALLLPFYGMWIPAGVAHEAWIVEDVELESLFIEPGQLAVPQHDCRVVQVGGFARAFIHHANGCIPERYDRQGKEGRMVGVLIDVLQALPDTAFNLPYPADARLARMCHAMQQTPGAPHRQQEWADALHMSARTFSRRFREETGLTFSLWRQRLRLLQAVILLQSGQSVTRIALDQGYNSPSAFTHAFTTLFGLPPRQFLRRHGAPGNADDPLGAPFPNA